MLEFHRMEQLKRTFILSSHLCSSKQTNESDNSRSDPVGSSSSSAPVVIGGMVLDTQASPSGIADIQRGGSVPGRVMQACGGVARNVCDALGRLCSGDQLPVFITVVGDDPAGTLLKSQWKERGLPMIGVLTHSGVSTPTVVTVFDRSGDVSAQVADVSTIERCLTPTLLRSFRSQIQAAPIVVLDANLSPAAIEAVCVMCSAAGVPIWFEPVSVPKCVRASKVIHMIDFVSPNERELVEMANAVRTVGNYPVLQPPSTNSGGNVRDLLLDLRPFIMILLESGVKYIFLTMGSHGAALCCKHPTAGQVSIFHLKALPCAVVNSSGAGDCLVGGAVAALMQKMDPLEALAHGMGAARLAVESATNVPPTLNAATVHNTATRILDTLQSITSTK